MPELKVVARTPAFAFKDTELDVRAVADSLDVAHVLEGSVRRDGERLRITAQLVEAETGFQLWSEWYERRLTDVFAIQVEIARSIAGRLEVTLGVEDPAELAREETESPEAYEEYLRGQFFWNQRTVPSLRRAVDHFRRAIALDSTYAQAYAGLANAYTVLPATAYRYQDTVELDLVALREEALGMARRAVGLAPGSAACQTALAAAHFTMGHWDRAEEHFRRAIELNPGYATARHWYGRFLAITGRAGEGVPHARRATELDPLSKVANLDAASILIFAGRLEEARRAVRRTIDLDPSLPRAWSYLHWIRSQLGEYDAALAALLERQRLRDADTTGVREHIRCRIRYLNTGEPQRCDPPPWADSLAYYLATGQKERALRATERHIASRPIPYTTLAFRYSRLGSELLGDDPRYRDLMESVGITW